MDKSSAETTFSEYVNILSGYAFKSKDFSDSGLKVIKIANINPPKVNVDSCDFVSTEVVHGLDRFKLSKGDLLMAMTGATVGKIGRLETNEICYLNQRVAKIIPKNQKHIGLVMALASTKLFRDSVEAAAFGSAQPNISSNGIGDIRVPFVSESRREKLSMFLENFANKIELNNQINETLEAMAKAIFKEWFIDFGPVKAKAAGKQPFGMDPATAALFPDSFEDSELGPIPRGWKVSELGLISEILNGFAFKSEDYKSSGVFVLRTKNFNEQGFAEKLQDDVFLSEEKAKEHASYYVQPFDIHLVMVAASIGKTSITPPCLLPALRNQNMWCFRNKVSFPYRHTLNLIVPLVSADLRGFSSGSARDFFRKGDFQKYKIVLPSKDLLIKAEAIFRALFEMISMNIEENITLKQTRDLLLPKLISGEIELKDIK